MMVVTILDVLAVRNLLSAKSCHGLAEVEAILPSGRARAVLSTMAVRREIAFDLSTGLHASTPVSLVND